MEKELNKIFETLIFEKNEEDLKNLSTEGRISYLKNLYIKSDSKNAKLEGENYFLKKQIDKLNLTIKFRKADIRELTNDLYAAQEKIAALEHENENLIKKIERMNSSGHTFDDGYKRCLSDIKGYISRKQEGEF